MQEIYDISYKYNRLDFILREKDEIVCVSDVILGLELMLNKLVEFIHIDIYQKLEG